MGRSSSYPLWTGTQRIHRSTARASNWLAQWQAAEHTHTRLHASIGLLRAVCRIQRWARIGEAPLTTLSRKCAGASGISEAQHSTRAQRDVCAARFCEQEGLSDPSFYVWRKRLRKRQPMRFALVEAGTVRCGGRAATTGCSLAATMAAIPPQVLRSFVASCQRVKAIPSLRSRTSSPASLPHPIKKIFELLSHN